MPCDILNPVSMFTTKLASKLFQKRNNQKLDQHTTANKQTNKQTNKQKCIKSVLRCRRKCPWTLTQENVTFVLSNAEEY